MVRYMVEMTPVLAPVSVVDLLIGIDDDTPLPIDGIVLRMEPMIQIRTMDKMIAVDGVVGVVWEQPLVVSAMTIDSGPLSPPRGSLRYHETMHLSPLDMTISSKMAASKVSSSLDP